MKEKNVTNARSHNVGLRLRLKFGHCIVFLFKSCDFCCQFYQGK